MGNRGDQPWASGPAEILTHGTELLARDSGTNRRLALIAIDNAVELAIKTYLGLPKRATGLSVPRRRLEEISESFPALLDALEEFAPDHLDGVDLASIEWYHRLRNQLYHQGYGLSVDREKVEIYAELANVLFKNLFGEAPLTARPPATELLGRFVELWPRLETALRHIASDHIVGSMPTALNAIRILRDGHILPEQEISEIEELRRLRNEIVHGVADFHKSLTEEKVTRLARLVESLEGVAGTTPAA